MSPANERIIELLKAILLELNHIHYTTLHKGNVSMEQLEAAEHPHGKEYKDE